MKAFDPSSTFTFIDLIVYFKAVTLLAISTLFIVDDRNHGFPCT